LIKRYFYPSYSYETMVRYRNLYQHYKYIYNYNIVKKNFV